MEPVTSTLHSYTIPIPVFSLCPFTFCFFFCPCNAASTLSASHSSFNGGMMSQSPTRPLQSVAFPLNNSDGDWSAFPHHYFWRCFSFFFVIGLVARRHIVPYAGHFQVRVSPHPLFFLFFCFACLLQLSLRCSLSFSRLVIRALMGTDPSDQFTSHISTQSTKPKFLSLQLVDWCSSQLVVDNLWNNRSGFFSGSWRSFDWGDLVSLYKICLQNETHYILSS